MHTKISIIIVVKNDRKIEETLRSLTNIPKPLPTEIVVVDSSDPSLLLDIRNNYPDVRWFYYQNATKGRSTVPEQRNIGLNEASGDILAFTDADCIPDKNWLAELCAPIIAGDEKFTSGSVRATDTRQLNLFSDENNPDVGYLPECASLNVAYDREVFDRVGSFDESFGGGSDVDFAWRSIDAGYRIYSVPQAIIYHNYGDFKDERKRAFSYGVTRVRLYNKHRNRIKQLFIGYDIKTSAYPLYMIFSPITLIFPWYLLLLLVPLYRARRSHPFKSVYMSFVHGAGTIKGLFSLIVLRRAL